MPEQPNQAKSIFLAAVEGHRPEQWPAFLDEACAGDAGLRAHVEQLLHAQAQLGSFHETAPPATTAEPAMERPGLVIGPYKLLQEIGEGGMGTVWMAEQTHPIQRKVALKIIKAGLDSRHVLARFEAERQALALMDHPNIAKVLDAGATGEPGRVSAGSTRGADATPLAGRPYFVMELVKGQPITAYCDQHRLTPKQRLELFIPVCQAIQHAHQKGIIHRDIKPSNVLVAPYDGKPVVKVIDFGVAKATGQRLTEKTLFTEFGAVVGTLEYMSPEQAELNNQDIDTRSDVYSLGVLLYELLTGGTPLGRRRLKETSFVELLRLIREVDPPKPSTRLAESGDTLPSVSAQRQMEPAKLTRLVRGELDWIVMKALEKDRNRRYETASAFAGDVQRYLTDEPVQACPPSVGYRLRKFARRNKVALTMASVVTLAVLLVAGSLGWLAWNRAVREKQVAQELATRSGMVEAFLRESDRHLQAKNWQLSLEEARRAQAALESGAVDEDLRDRIAERLKDLQMVGDLEEYRTGRWDTYPKDETTYSSLFRRYGIDVDALGTEEAAALIGNRAIRDFLVGALDYCALEGGNGWYTNWVTERAKAGEKGKGIGPRLLAISRAVDRDEFRNRIRDALHDQAALDKLADSTRVAELPPATARLLAGAVWRGKAIPILRQVQARHPDDLELTSALATYLSNDPKTLPDGIRYYQAAVALRPRSLGLLANLAIALGNAGRHDEALFVHQRAAEVHPLNAHAQYNWGYALQHAGRLTEAVAVLKETIRLQEDMAAAHTALGLVYRRLGQFQSAIVSYRRAIELGPQLAEAHSGLGAILGKIGQLEEAEARCRRVIELKPKYALAYSNLGAILAKQGRIDEAIACLQKAIELDPAFAPAHHNLGQNLVRKGKLGEAILSYRKAIELDPKSANAHVDLGTALTRQGKAEEAITCYRTALDLEPNNSYALRNLGTVLERQGKTQEALDCYHKALALDPKDTKALNGLAWALATCADLKLRNSAEAVKLAEASTRLAPGNGGNWNTLGVARYRAGEDEAAVAALTKSMELSKGGDANDWFFMAMAQQRMDGKEEARRWYDRAVQWMDKHDPTNEELRRFRAEAEELLGIKKKD